MVMVNSGAGGFNLAISVNLTPPVPNPVPYPNFALRSLAIPNVPNIVICGGTAHNKATLIPVTVGDQPGSAGGVASGTVGAASINTTGSSKVLVGMAPQTRNTDATLQNATNAPGTGALPTQTKMFVFT